MSTYIKLPMIGKYHELFEGYPEKMRDHIQDTEYPDKEEIVKYLKNAFAFAAKPQCLVDVFSGESIPMESLEMADGSYRWPSELLYYVEKYNLVLPEEFVEHIHRSKNAPAEPVI